MELRARATPTGYLLQFLMLQIIGSGVLLISAGDTGGRQFATVVLVLAAGAITAVACSRYGFRYEVAGPGEAPARRSRSR